MAGAHSCRFRGSSEAASGKRTGMRVIQPDWPAAPWIKAASTTRTDGFSKGPFESLNLGLHVGDDPGDVANNREKLLKTLGLNQDPIWLNQVHGRVIVEASSTHRGANADGSVLTQPGETCIVMTADCLPILIATQDGSRVAALHGGWKGLLAGILEAAVQRLNTQKLWVWLGPAIGPDAFEVGPEVLEAFVLKHPSLQAAFKPHINGKLLADIYEIARILLEISGIPRNQVFGGHWCTYRQSDDFFSYRRDQITGRMATLIWLESHPEKP
jgi:YfiH family protein